MFEPGNGGERMIKFQVTPAQDNSDTSSGENDQSESIKKDIPPLQQVKLFLINGNAFENLYQNLRQFINQEKVRYSFQ